MEWEDGYSVSREMDSSHGDQSDWDCANRFWEAASREIELNELMNFHDRAPVVSEIPHDAKKFRLMAMRALFPDEARLVEEYGLLL